MKGRAGAVSPQRHGLWINGESRDGRAGSTVTVEYPYDRSTFAEVTAASVEDVQEAISVAERAYKDVMRRLPAHERARILRRTSQLIGENADELIRIVVHEAGKPVRDARREVGRARELFDMAADHARQIEGEIVPMDAVSEGENRFGFALRVPLGVIAAIAPFNSPVNLSTNKIAPALAAGNSVVLKPASKTPVSALFLAQLLHEAGLPAGALNVVVGPAEVVGEALVRDQRVRMVTFTGSTAAGQRIAQLAGIKRLALELGSSSANIVCADADIVAAAKSLATSAYMSSGQACIRAQRLLVHASVAERFLASFIPLVESMRIGDPFDEATQIGPMVSEGELQRILSWIEEARAAGARVLTGGERVGNTVRPTLMSDLPASTRLAREEAFAPVATFATFTSDQEAVALANGSSYGLQAGVYTHDLDRTLFFARELEVGGLWVNESSRYRQDNYPFGGVKLSGIGKEGVKYAIEEMTELKFIGIKTGPSSSIL